MDIKWIIIIIIIVIIIIISVIIIMLQQQLQPLWYVKSALHGYRMDGYHTIVHVLRTPVVLTLATMGVIRLVPICTAMGMELGSLRIQPATVSLEV